MYTAAQVSIPSYKDKIDVAFTRFIAKIRPWIVESGSALDIEEWLHHYGLPLTRDGWKNLTEGELNFLDAVGDYWYAGARAFFRFPGTSVGAFQIGARYVGAYPAQNYDGQVNVPMQVGVDLGHANGFGSRSITFTGNATLVSGSPYNIDTVNAAVRAAGLLGANENAIERGRRRVVIRKEFFRWALGASAVSAAARNSVPYLPGLTISVGILTLGYNTGAGVRASVGDVVTSSAGGTATVLWDGGNGTTGTLYVTANTGTFANSNTLTTPSGFSATATGAVTAGTHTTPNPIPAIFYFNDFTFTNPYFSELANLPLVGSTPVGIGGSMESEAIGIGQLLAGGNSVGLLPTFTRARDLPRVDNLNGVADALRYVAGLFTQVARGNITEVPATASSYRTDLANRRLFASTSHAVGYHVAVKGQYASGNGTKPIDGETITGQTSGGKARVSEHVGDGTTGSFDLQPVPGFRWLNPTEVVKGDRSGSSATLDGAGISRYALTGQHVGPIESGGATVVTPNWDNLTRVASIGSVIAKLTQLQLRLNGVSGGLLAEIDALSAPAAGDRMRPDRRNTNAPQLLKALEALAWLADADINTAAIPTVFQNAAAIISRFGWDSAIAGDNLTNLQAMLRGSRLSVDRLLTDAILVASGHPWAFRFMQYTPKQLGTAQYVRPGMVYLTNPGNAVTNQLTVAMRVYVEVPTLGANLKTGAFTLSLPRGLKWSVATFQATAPNPTASVSGVGTRTLVISFDDTAGGGFAAGSKHLLNVTIAAEAAGPAVGSRQNGVAITGTINSGWLAVGSSVELANQFFLDLPSVVTELR